jgi:outer membrane autotransporter protein
LPSRPWRRFPPIAHTLVSEAKAQCVVNDPSNLFLLTAQGAKPVSQAGLVGIGASAVTSIVAATNTVNTAFLTQTTAFIGSPANPNPNQVFGGAWARGIAGEVTTKSSSTSTGNLTFLPNNNLGTATGSCNEKTQVTYAGYQAGVDLAKLKIGDGETNVYFGATVGYVGASASDVTTGTGALVTPGGNFALPADFSGQFQVPFVGAYGALTRGGFFVDGQLLASFYEPQLNSPSTGLFDQRMNARGLSVNGNIGYHYDTGWNNWFVEPSVGVNWSRVQVDPLSFAGTFATLVNPAATTALPNTTLQINDIDSVLGRIGVRVGTTATWGNLAITPFASLALWHEFAGNVTAAASGLTNGIANNVNGGGAIQPLLNTGSLSVSRVGTYGQLSGGVAWQFIGTGWLGYARFDVRDGENITAVGFNGGLRYQFDPALITPVGIFKAPVKAPVPVVELVNWTGFYVGAFASTGWGTTDWTFIGPNTQTTAKMSGFLGGGEVGWNYQVNAFVFGVEADGGLGGLFGGAACPNAFNFTCNESLRWMATATGRIGYAWDRVLFFAKGGGAWIKDDYAGTCNFGPFSAASGRCIAPVFAASDRRTGWTVGAGFEYALAKYWSAKAEYDYADFGTKRDFFTDGEVADIKKTVNLVKIGVNYCFAWEPPPAAPVVTKY